MSLNSNAQPTHTRLRTSAREKCIKFTGERRNTTTVKKEIEAKRQKKKMKTNDKRKKEGEYK